MKKPILSSLPPDLEGLTWRSLTQNDLGAIGELADKCQLVDGGLAWLNEPDNLMSRHFPDAPTVTIGTFTSGERLVACTSVHLVRESKQELAVINGQVRPEWRSRGLGTFLMDWSQAQAEMLFTPTIRKRLVRIATESLTEPARKLYHKYGFERVREDLVMRCDLDDVLLERPLPHDVTTADWQLDLADQFFEVYDASFRENPGFPGYSAIEWITDRLGDDDFKPQWSLLARAGDVPIGFLTAGAMDPSGFIIQVGVIPEQRRRGVGSALMIEARRRMQADGMESALLTVNVNYAGAIEAYTKLGFVIAGRRARFEKLR